jgi:hypothetical protein
MAAPHSGQHAPPIAMPPGGTLERHELFGGSRAPRRWPAGPKACPRTIRLRPRRRHAAQDDRLRVRRSGNPTVGRKHRARAPLGNARPQAEARGVSRYQLQTARVGSIPGPGIDAVCGSTGPKRGEGASLGTECQSNRQAALGRASAAARSQPGAAESTPCGNEAGSACGATQPALRRHGSPNPIDIRRVFAVTLGGKRRSPGRRRL